MCGTGVVDSYVCLYNHSKTTDIWIIKYGTCDHSDVSCSGCDFGFRKTKVMIAGLENGYHECSVV